MRKKICILLILALCATMIPMASPVFADSGGTAIALGAAVLAKDKNTADAATVYYGSDGTNPYSWRVVGYDGNGAATLLSAGNLKSDVKFDSSGNSNVYATSTLKNEVESVAGRLSQAEQAAVTKRTLAAGSYSGTRTECVAGTEVENAVMWPLSTLEAGQVAVALRRLDEGTGRDWASDYWWLRSPGYSVDDAAVVEGGGFVRSNGSFVGRELGVRPAFYLNLDSVLFTSAAAGGKSSGAAGADALTAISAYTGSEWKLTLKDASRSAFSASLASGDGSVLTIDYSNAETGSNEYISAVITDSSDGIKYYGRLAEVTSASGNCTVDLAGKFDPGDALYVFNEQVNDGKFTDYASPLQHIEWNASYVLSTQEWTVSDSGYTDIDCTFDSLVFGPISNENEVASSITFEMKSGWLTNKQGKRLDFLVSDSSHASAGSKVVCGPISARNDPFIFSVHFDPDDYSSAAPGTYTGTLGYSCYWNKDPGLSVDGGFIVLTVVIPEPPVLEQAATPTFEPAETTFTDSVDVTISCVTTGAAIRYSLDGGQTFTTGAAITLNETTTIQAVAFADGYTDSEVAEITYTKEEPAPDPTPNGKTKDKDEDPAEDAFPFTDVPEDAYYRKAVEWAWKNGVVAGMTPTTFDPAENATRAQMVTFLWAAAGAPEPVSTENPFADVSESDYFYKAVLWAYENGITAGVTADKFGVEQTVSRAQAATFLWAAAGAPESSIANPFADVSESDYFYKAVLWAYESGVTSGTSASTFSPEANCLRCQIVTFLYQTYGAE